MTTLSSKKWNSILHLVASFSLFVPLSKAFAPSIDMPTTTPEPTTTTADPATLPYFRDHKTITNITATKGHSTMLSCQVFRLKDRTVSWLKREGDRLDLLTFGLTTYHSDSRYALLFIYPNNWGLQIQSVQERDAGTYECQVSTHPPMIRTVNLNVIVPLVEIQDMRGTEIKEKFYETGSSIELQCVGYNVPPQVELTWLKENIVLSSHIYPPSNVSVSFSGNLDLKKLYGTSENPRSWLRIKSASRNDTGNYSCNAAEAQSAYTKIHVLDGEDSVAMQHSTNSGLQSSENLCQFCLYIYCFSFFISSKHMSKW